MPNQEIKVSNCNDCPFASMGGWEGEITLCKLDPERRTISKMFEPVKVRPEWCGLENSIVTISLKDGSDQ